jgi:WhiB family redox-sensing transcriptional regulator
VFFPARNDGFTLAVARQLCRGCAVRAECLTYALELGADLVGVWGGTSERQRRALRARTSVTSAS